MVINLIIPFFGTLYAEDYPAGYLDSGYREYLSGKIQSGYYIDVFTKIDMRQKERVNKRNQVEEILTNSYQAGPQSANQILTAEYLLKGNAQDLTTTITKQKQQREQVAAAQTEFNYIPYEDGRIEYFKDGLASRIENEKTVDEFGNVSRKDTYDMNYNDKRLLTGYEAKVTDKFGNTSRLSWYGAQYSPDSLFYANKDTTAVKNLSEYFMKEVDPAGNAKLTHVYASVYEGKFLTAFSQAIEDDVYGKTTFTQSNITYDSGNIDHKLSFHEEGLGYDGLSYNLDRYNTTYNGKDQVTGYREDKTVLDEGGKIREILKTDAAFTYEDAPLSFGAGIETPYPDKLVKSVFTVTQETTDGASRTETTSTDYEYATGNEVISASGTSKFFGTDGFGNDYQGDSIMSYSLYHGRPELTRNTSLSESWDMDGTWKYEESTTEYLRNWYGILIDAYGLGDFIGGDGLGNNHYGISNIIYKIVNGRALPVEVKETIYAK